MAAAKPLTTLVSSKGQVILPKSVREQRGWDRGVRLEVVDTAEGVLLRAMEAGPLFPPTRMEDVFGMLKPYYNGPPVSIEEMREAAIEGAVKRYERSLRSSDQD